jgi:hypothetical protein
MQTPVSLLGYTASWDLPLWLVFPFCHPWYLLDVCTYLYSTVCTVASLVRNVCHPHPIRSGQHPLPPPSLSSPWGGYFRDWPHGGRCSVFFHLISNRRLNICSRTGRKCGLVALWPFLSCAHSSHINSCRKIRITLSQNGLIGYPGKYSKQRKEIPFSFGFI